MKYFTRILIAASLSLICLGAAWSEPPNLSLVRNDVRHYHDSGRYYHELAAQIKQAKQYILQQVLANQHSKKPLKLALVLDIDETSLSNYDKMVTRDFVGSHQQIVKEIQAANAPALKATLDLYRFALKNNVSVFFVTGREESLRKVTEANLIKIGYTKWSGLYLRPNQYLRSSIIPFKSQTRAMITKKGYVIIASIGDQYSDIRGGYAKKGFKLPNPFYYLP